MSRTDEIDKIVDEIGDADSLYEFAECVYEDRQRIAELEEQLKNAIVPKFKVGQEIYIVCDFNINRIVYGWKIADYEYYKQLYIVVNKDGIDWLPEEKIFATKEEAEAKLRELGEKK